MKMYFGKVPGCGRDQPRQKRRRNCADASTHMTPLRELSLDIWLSTELLGSGAVSPYTDCINVVYNSQLCVALHELKKRTEHKMRKLFERLVDQTVVREIAFTTDRRASRREEESHVC